MSIPSGQPRAPGSASPSCPTGSPAVMTRTGCRLSVTGSGPGTSRRSSTGGPRSSLSRSPRPTGSPGTGGSCPCARSRYPAPWCSTPPARHGRSSRPWWPTTSTSADPSTLSCCSSAHPGAANPKTRLLETEKAGQGCVFDSPAFARISQPALTEDGRRAPGLRFGDPRVMALAGALASTLCAVTGITNKSLRALMTGLLGTTYSINQASYDLGRLTRNGIITRIPHHNLYALTPDGLRFAIFYTKVHDRVLRPLMAGDQPQAPQPLRDALRTIDHEVSRRLTQARLPAAA